MHHYHSPFIVLWNFTFIIIVYNSHDDSLNKKMFLDIENLSTGLQVQFGKDKGQYCYSFCWASIYSWCWEPIQDLVCKFMTLCDNSWLCVKKIQDVVDNSWRCVLIPRSLTFATSRRSWITSMQWRGVCPSGSQTGTPHKQGLRYSREGGGNLFIYQARGV